MKKPILKSLELPNKVYIEDEKKCIENIDTIRKQQGHFNECRGISEVFEKCRRARTRKCITIKRPDGSLDVEEGSEVSNSSEEEEDEEKSDEGKPT